MEILPDPDRSPEGSFFKTRIGGSDETYCQRIVYILLTILLLLALTMPGHAVKEGTYDYRLELTDSSGNTVQVQLTSSVPQSAFAKS